MDSADSSAADKADYSQSWQVMSYARDSGITQQRVFDIAFQPDGTAWLAADDGLHQFDGYQWTLLGTSNGLPSSFMRATCVDSQGRLWLGSDAGAGIWDPRTKKYAAQGVGGSLANDNVREIVAGPDHSLWFACDQWPEITPTSGGLSCLKPNGTWQTFHQTDGLPMDYVIGYFRDTAGRQFALTPHGWGQRSGDRWGPPVNPGYQAEDCVLEMAEANDGTLFAQGEHTLLVLSDGRWQNYAQSHTKLVCSLKNGQVAAVEYNATRGQLWFSLWDGHKFVRASATVPCPSGSRFYHLREAPDGSLWCVGTGVVVRWKYQAGKWTLYSQLPPPVGADQQGRVWFAENDNLYIADGQQIKKLPAGHFWALNPAGQALLWDDSQGKMAVTDPQNPAVREWVETGCKGLRAASVDGQGVFWLLAYDAQNNELVIRCENGRAQTISSPEFAGYTLSVCTPLGSNEVRLVAHRRDNNLYGVLRIADGKVEWQPFTPNPPPITYPNLIFGAGRKWLYGYSSLYVQSLTAPDHWDQVKDIPDSGFTGGALTSSNEMYLTFSGGRSGHPGCALYAANQYQRVYGGFGRPAWDWTKKIIYVPTRNGINIRRTPGTLDFEFLPLPGDNYANQVVSDPVGNLWVGTAAGTFHYRPTHEPPNTIAMASVTELPQGAALPVRVWARERFEENGDTEFFVYSWRIDNGPWSPFQAWSDPLCRQLKLALGSHVLEVRSRDVDGNIDDSPASVSFTILPQPIQNQAWFRVLVVLVGCVLAWLLWLRLNASRQLAAANEGLRREIAVRRQTEAELERARNNLEQRVIQRTEQLTRTNEQLQHEIVERQQTEAVKQKLEAELHQSQKLEAVGTLAGGIAHDFNNLLAVIIPYCDLVIDDLPGRPDLQEHLREVLKAANRAKNLVQQILTFSRRQPQQRLICHIQPVVKEALKLLRSALPSSIQIVQQIGPTHPVLADPTQIHQIIMNLGVNAQHAMEGRQGRLEIQVDEISADEALCEQHAELQPKQLYVRLSLRDTGCGISPENMERIFEPFFTTREVGQGSGLGLAVVHGIVQHHGGTIFVKSEVGRGTEFQILLPARNELVTENQPVEHYLAMPAQGQHILIVDDEVAIIRVMQRLLVRAGYQVSAHTRPEDALQLVVSHPNEIDLVLTDLTMPGLDGLELAEKISVVRQDLPVIIATGFGGDLISREQLTSYPNVRRVVEKPLNPEAILQLIAELLKASAAGEA